MVGVSHLDKILAAASSSWELLGIISPHISLSIDCLEEELILLDYSPLNRGSLPVRASAHSVRTPIDDSIRDLTTQVADDVFL